MGDIQPIVDVLKEASGLNPERPLWNKAPSLDASWIYLGYLVAKVLFVGQDMSVRADGKYYTDDSAYADTGSHFTHKKDGHILPGNCEDEVLVEGRLFVYLKTFEKFISENNQVEYRNLASLE